MNPETPLYPVPIGAKNSGITIHDWLAGVVLQALITKGMAVKADRAMTEDEKDLELATRAYSIADAMLNVRETVAAARAEQETARAQTTASKSDASKA